MGNAWSPGCSSQPSTESVAPVELQVVSSSSESSVESHSENVQIVQVPFPCRESSLNKVTWFIVDLFYEPKLKRGATPLVHRCIRTYGWTESYARRVLKAYKQFLELKTQTEDWHGKKLVAPVAVDQLWLQHALDLPNYVHDCTLLCGHVVFYDPDRDLASRESQIRRMEATYQSAKERFGDELDEDLWTFDSSGLAPSLDSPRAHNNAGEPSKEAAPAESMIKIGFEDIVSDAQYYFIVHPDESFGKAFSAVAKRLQVSVEEMEFVSIGQSVLMDQTPRMLEMQAGGIIQILHTQKDDPPEE